MRLIDADRLLQRAKFYNLKNGNRAIDEIDILHAPTVNAISLDKVKQAREEIYARCGSRGLDDYDYCSGLIFARNVLDKLIESEGLINDKSIL